MGNGRRARAKRVRRIRAQSRRLLERASGDQARHVRELERRLEALRPKKYDSLNVVESGSFRVYFDRRTGEPLSMLNQLGGNMDRIVDLLGSLMLDRRSADCRSRRS